MHFKKDYPKVININQSRERNADVADKGSLGANPAKKFPKSYQNNQMKTLAQLTR
jgi:hypothetical protein